MKNKTLLYLLMNKSRFIVLILIILVLMGGCRGPEVEVYG
jgi:hypothetical protein